MISSRNFIMHHYGSKRGLLNLYKFGAQQLFFSTYSSYQQLPETINRVVFVCKGNICRSPLAEEVFRKKSPVATASFGLDTQSGHPAHPPIVKASMCQGYDLSNHTTTFVDSFTVQQGDLYVCTEPAHVDKLRTVLGTQRIMLLGLFGKPRRVYIHDPYSSTHEYTEKTVRYIVSAAENLATAIKANSRSTNSTAS